MLNQKSPKEMITRELMIEIDKLQQVQKRNPMASIEWQLASERLAPMFEEMKTRQTAGMILS